MPDLYPAIEPSRSEYVSVGDGHEVYFEQCGNPIGIPVLFLHGGPGSSCNPQHRRFFDPKVYRILLFDQRGCGRSRPRGAVVANTTDHLLADMEKLRLHLKIDRWILLGGSWGSTLALAYMMRHRERVLAMVLRGVFLASHAELEWYCEGLRGFVPEAWERFVRGISNPNRVSILDHYARAIQTDASAASAARSWNDYEAAIMAIGESASGGSSGYDETALAARVRVQIHYLVHDCFLEAPLLSALSGIQVPTVIVQGRRDLVCPPQTAYDVHRAITGSELVMVEAGGHSAMHPAVIAALVTATDNLRETSIATL